ncbi:hypothetical protein EBB07_31690 [Paenibacillaceae bacterium]|nr:hypothetical protein EBB07_31690 [Paenibacillaceae bacterium]
MRQWRAIAGAFGVTLAIMLCLTLLLRDTPALQEPDSTTAVITPQKIAKVSNDNLVDLLVQSPFQQQLRRAGWDQGLLKLDFMVREDANADAIISDILQLLELAFVRVSNVDQLTVRFLEGASLGTASESSREQHLVIADLHRTDEGLQRLMAAVQTGGTIEKRQLEDGGISFSKRWTTRFRL